MKNVILISTLLAAGTLAANAATTLSYTNVGSFYVREWWGGDERISLLDSDLRKYSGFYTFKTSEYDFSNLKSAKLNIYLYGIETNADLKIWAVKRKNTDLNGDIAKGIITSVDTTKGFVSTSLTTAQKKSMLSIDITSVLQKIKKGNAVAILIGVDTYCDLDYRKGDRTTLSVEFSAVPEPSLFGLLAGTLALVLAGTRRRRRK